MRQLIDQYQRRLALQGGVQIEFGQLLVAIRDLLHRQQFQAIQHGSSFGTAMALDHASQYLTAFAMQFMRGPEHCVGLSDTRRGTEIDAQLSPPGQTLLHLQLRQESIRIGT